ncbi:glycosyltransferase family 4 protein [Planktomarina sp.]|nr:glycosyltransferase family 4 protein [Planktomarina sp.]
MRLLLLTFYFEPDLCAGSFRSSALLKELINNDDIHVDVVTTQPNRYAEYIKVADAKQEINKNITIYRIRTPRHANGILDQMISFAYFFWGANRLIRNNYYDVVYASSARLFTAVLGARIARRLQKPLYVDVRDIFVKMSAHILAEKHLSFFQFLITGFEKYAFSSAAKINLVSGGFENYFKQKFPTKPLSFHSNGIDEIFLNNNSLKERSNNERLSILYAGNIGDGQGLHKILPGLARELSSVAEIRVVGAGGKLKELREEIEKSTCSNIKIEKPVGQKELVDYYRNCDILFLHLNSMDIFEEVLPSKLFEYAATGKPILAGVNGFASEFIRKNIINCEVFEPCNVEACVSSLRKLTVVDVDRSEFINRHLRSEIMKKMVLDIRDCVDKS